MRIAILHSPVDPGAPPDELDTLEEARAVAEAVAVLGHETSVLACSLDLGATARALAAAAPDVVFNLVESIEGTGRLIHLAPSLVEHLRLPMTGSPADALYLTSNKLLAKEILTLAGVPTPAYASIASLAAGAPLPDGRLIVKSVWEHASVGLDDDSIIAPRDREHLAGELVGRAGRLGGSCFAEEYVHGREFNLSVIETAEGLRVLPFAEIVFEGFPEGKPRMVGYKAKWDTESFEYGHTVRSFAFGDEDGPLLERMGAISRRCFDVFGLRGYARVDFRVDDEGRPFVLEVNANPCVSPDSGFTAAAERAGIRYPALIGGILRSATAPRGAVDTRVDRGPAGGRAVAGLALRGELLPADRGAVERIVRATGYFSEEEVAVALELVDDNLARGEAGGYSFVVASRAGEVVGYACYGKVPATRDSWDLYWIAVDPALQGQGVGAVLSARAAALVRALGGRRLYAETSGRAQYLSTRRFYEASGYEIAARLPDFYGPGDDKVIYALRLDGTPVSGL
jgi:D-alanine-D-alanine ligase-like ATP-grasp enzyme/ribosomal protein S18 acetylase RimI-like enzyme